MRHSLRKLLPPVFCFGLLLVGFASDAVGGFKVEAAQRPRPRWSRARAKKKPAEPSPAQIAARREAVHAMMLEGGYQHDGAGELLYIGDITSVPALLRVLKDNPPIERPDGRLSYVCTTVHAISALVKVTGHSGPRNYEEWSAWWGQYQRENPRK